MSVSLILDGYELVDARTLESYAVADGARICVVSRRSRSGVGWRLLNEVWRWWPLLGGLALISVLYAEAFGWVPGDDVARCDTPLTPFLACVGPIFVPYGIVFSGVYQKDRGKRLLWFVKARVLNATVAVAALFALGGFASAPSGSSTERRRAATTRRSSTTRRCSRGSSSWCSIRRGSCC